mgnify:CR=1
VKHATLSSGSSGNQHIITDHQGVKQTYDVVVSNADIHHTYEKIYADHPVAVKRTKKLEKMDWSMSLFVLHFGTDIE